MAVPYFFIQAGLCLTNMYLPVMLRNQVLPYALIGTAMAVHELLGMVGPLCTGAFSDRTGKIKLANITCMLASMGLLALMTFTHSVFIVFLCISLLGFFLKSVYTLLDAGAMRYVRGDSQRYSFLRSFETLGCVVFSLLYSVLHIPDETDNKSILLLFLIGSSVYSILMAFSAKDELVQKGTVVHEGKKTKWYDHAFVLGLSCVALTRLALTSVNYLSLYMVEVIHSDSIILMQAVSCSAEFVAMLVTGKMLKKRQVSSVTLLTVSAFVTAIRLYVYIAVPTLWGVVLGQSLHAFSFGIFQPALMCFVTEHIAPSHRAEGISLMQALGTGLPTMVGSLIGGFVIGRYGFRMMFFSFGIPSFVAGILFLILRKRLYSSPCSA